MNQEAKADTGKLRPTLVPENVRWAYIPGYADDYVVCDDGNILSIKRNLVMKQRKDKKGYCYVSLCKNGKYKSLLVHRIVADAFCDKSSKVQNCVNHKDEDKQNNHASNLEWCTVQYNNNYGTARERAARKRARMVRCFKLDGTTSVYQSCTVASKDTGISQGNIWGACNGLWIHAGGMKWEYV